MSRDAAELALEGEYWTVVYGNHEFRMRDSKGLRHLAELLARPGREISAVALAGGPQLADAGPVLDEPAKRAYRRRVVELREEIEMAEAFHDPERAARARLEHDAVAGELAAATGLGGRDRRAGSPAERARLNVTRAIRAAIARIEKHDRALGEHLSTSVHTGRVCVYRPALPVAWTARARTHGAQAPETLYARSGDVKLAYQVLGRGPPDLVFVPGFLSHVDMQWTFPAPATFFRRLAAFSRLILYDKRGQGVSDRPAGVPTLEQDCGGLDGEWRVFTVSPAAASPAATA